MSFIKAIERQFYLGVNDMYDDYEDDDYCYECGGYGDDYFINDDRELECYCPYCSINPNRPDDWDE